MARSTLDQDQIVQLLETKVDLETRTIYLSGELTEESAARFLIAFRKLDRIRGRIHVFLMCRGGNELEGYAIYDALRSAQNAVTVLGYGPIQSIGAIVLQGGDRRVLAPTSRFMIHDGTIEVAPGATDIRAAVATARESEVLVRDYYHRILARHSGLPLKKIQEYAAAESYFNAQEAVRLGFADAVLPVRRRR